MYWIRTYTPGLLLVIAIALLSAWLGSLFPLIGGPVFGIVLGLLVGNTVGKPRIAHAGIRFSSKQILQWAIIALGCGLSLRSVWQTGVDSFAVMIASLLAALLAAFAAGRLLRIPGRLSALIGVGTGICGGSAIAAVSPIIEADDTEIAYSISTIFLFNVAAVLLFPALGHLFGMSDQAFGTWAGTAINDTSSVVAAGYIYSHGAGDYATIVKLARTTMIIPIAFGIALLIGLRKKREQAADRAGSPFRFSQVFPWFILWFLVASLFQTLGLFGDDFVRIASRAAHFMIVMALTAIGLSANLRAMLKTGFRPIVFGCIVWFAVSIVSLAVQWMSGQL